MAQAVEFWRGSVNTWECDNMGHMNVRFYVAKSIEALGGLAAELALPRAFAADAETTLMVREQHIRFLKEAHPHAPLFMTGGVVAMDDSEAQVLLLLHHANSGDLAASFLTRIAHVQSGGLAPVRWSAATRERAGALQTDVPPQAAPRGLSLEAPSGLASRSRAERLGVPPYMKGMVSPADCDVFGRMRPELVIGRISDGMPNMLRPGAPGSPPNADQRVGGAAVEYRLIYLAWPKAGDRLELRSGWAGAEARVRRQVHWLLNPADGTPWAVGATIYVALNVDTRKMVTLSDAELADARAEVVEGLSL